MTTTDQQKLHLLRAIARAERYGQQAMARAYGADLRALDARVNRPGFRGGRC